MSVSCPLRVRNYTQVFPGPGKRRKNIALQSSQPNETQEARDNSRRISMRKHTCYEESKERDPIQLGGNKKKLHKGGGKRGCVGGRKEAQWEMASPWRRRTSIGMSILLTYTVGTEDLRRQQLSWVHYWPLRTVMKRNEANYIHATLSFAGA